MLKAQLSLHYLLDTKWIMKNNMMKLQNGIISRTSLDNAVCYNMLEPGPTSPVSNVIAKAWMDILKSSNTNCILQRELVSCPYWWPFHIHCIFTKLPFYFAATHMWRTTLIHNEINYDSTDFTCTVFRQYWTHVFRLFWRLLHVFSHLMQSLHQIVISFILTHG